MTDYETSRAAFLAWYELQCADNPQLRTAEARVLSWRAWQANAGANMGNSQVSAANLPEPDAWLASYQDREGNEASYVTTHYALAVENDERGQPVPLYRGAGLVPVQDPKDE